MTPIIGSPSAPYTVVRDNAIEEFAVSAWYLRALVAIWDAGWTWGVDPVVMAAQCGKETAWGRFGGAVTSDMGNLAGIKIRSASGDRKQDHATFPFADGGFPAIGALAQAHHLRLYAGFPVPVDTPDPRAVFLSPGTSKFGSALFVEQLGGNWAPSSTYGKEIVAIMRKLSGSLL